jgi:endonuclease-3
MSAQRPRRPRAGRTKPTRRKATPGWKLPDPERLRTVRDRLRAYYGRPRNVPHRAPLDELVLTILSQNTNDRNRDVAYTRLRGRFGSWDEVADAPQREVEDAIKPGGISKVKSRRIREILRTIRHGSPTVQTTSDPVVGSPTTGLSLSLDWLEHASREKALDFLERLPGVGRKTAACVLLFSYDRPELPVDTHVYRVSSRLGLIRPKATFDEAHETLRALADPRDAYELHVNLLRHGRRLCKPQRPLCDSCPLLRVCPHGQALTASESGKT